MSARPGRFEVLANGVWKENPVLVTTLGLCPTLAVTNSVANSLTMGLARVGVAVLSESWRELARSAGAAVRDLASDEVLRVCLVHREGRLSPAAAAFLPR